MLIKQKDNSPNIYETFWDMFIARIVMISLLGNSLSETIAIFLLHFLSLENLSDEQPLKHSEKYDPSHLILHIYNSTWSTKFLTWNKQHLLFRDRLHW